MSTDFTDIPLGGTPYRLLHQAVSPTPPGLVAPAYRTSLTPHNTHATLWLVASRTLLERSMTIVRWLHVSDFHVGMDDYGHRVMFSAILNDVHARCARGLAPQFLLITGDIANKGAAPEYEHFVECFLTPFASAAPSCLVFQVPGNHDVDRKAAPLVTRDAMKVRAPRLLDPTPEGLQWRQNILPRFKAYIQNDMSHTGGEWLESTAGVYVKRIDLTSHSVAIVGINSAWYAEDDADEGELGACADMLDDAISSIAAPTLVLVLGHHPLRCFSGDDETRLRAVLGKHRAIYLHGHLHRSHSAFEDSSGGMFWALQAGASFHARSDERWQNRILWATADLAAGTIDVEALVWVATEREWRVDGTAFPAHFRAGDVWRFAKPSEASGPATMRRDIEGWEIVTQDFVTRRTNAATPDTLLRFFDGANPTWDVALSSGVRARTVVGQVVDAVVGGAEVLLVAGPGGEGKSTVLLQASASLLATSAVEVAFVRKYSEATLDLKAIREVCQQRGYTRSMVVVDDAHTAAQSIYAALIGGNDLSGMVFLLCARDSDWNAEDAHRLGWSEAARFVHMRLRGLSESDALLVVDGWFSLGGAGAGRLNGLDRTDAARRLYDRVLQEAEVHEGAFLGGLLHVRIGEDLRDHVRSMIVRFENRSAGKLQHLARVFAYICVMHVEAPRLLTDAALCWALGVSMKDMRRRLLVALGEEAAANAHGSSVSCRHAEIARAALSIYVQERGYAVQELLEDLVLAVDSAAERGEIVRNLDGWRYGIVDRLLHGKRFDDAVGLASALVRQRPDNPFFVTKLSSVLRASGDPAEAFRTISQTVGHVHLARDATRPFLLEWAAASAAAGLPSLATWLVCVAMSDLGGLPLGSRNLGIGVAIVGEDTLKLSDGSLRTVAEEAWKSRERDVDLDVLRLDERLTFARMRDLLNR